MRWCSRAFPSRPGPGRRSRPTSPRSSRGDRRAGHSLPRASDQRRLALSLDRRDLCESAAERPRRLAGGDHRRGRQRRRTSRSARHGHRPLGGRDLLDRVPTQAQAARPARGQARHLRRPRRHQGGGRQSDQRGLATLPRPLHAQCPGPCRQERPAGRLRFHRHRLRSGRRDVEARSAARSPTGCAPSRQSSRR